MNAPTKALEIKGAIAASFAFVTALIGWVGWLIILWLGTMLLDYLTGSWAAMCHNEWTSKRAREGLWHKLGSIFAVLIAAMCDVAMGVIIPQLGLPFDYPAIIAPIVCAWYIFTELGSIIENIDKLGAPVPGFLRKIISKAHDEIDSFGNDKSEK